MVLFSGFSCPLVCAYPLIKKGKKIIIAAHGNSLRRLVKYIENLNEEEIVELNIPTGVPLVYEFDNKMNVKDKYFKDSTELNSELIGNI